MLAATKAGDTQTMTKLMEYAHNTHSPLKTYSNEAELASILRVWGKPGVYRTHPCSGNRL